MRKFRARGRGWHKLVWLAFFAALVFGSRASLAAAEKLTAERVTNLIPQLFRLHLCRHEMDPAFMRLTIKEFVTQLDPGNRFFLKGEADALVSLTDEQLRNVADEVQDADFSHFTALLQGFLDTQIARDAALYGGLEERAAEIKALVADKPVAAADDKGAVKFDAAKPAADAGADDQDELDKVKWTERPAAQSEREARLLKTVAAFYRLNKTYLSETEALKLAVQTVSDERNKWLKVSVDQEVPKLFLKSFMAAMDPHTVYFDEDEDDFAERLERSFQGIGVQIRPCPLGAQIDDIIKGGPSDKSGRFARGDQIVAVDNVPLAGLPINKIVRRIKGEHGSEVKITLVKRETKQTEVVALKRDTIELGELRVKGKKYDTPAGPVGVVVVQTFYRDVHKDVADRIQELSVPTPLAGVVLDLRYNQGGFLEEAVALAGLFIGQGPIVGERDGENHVDWKYDTDPSLLTCPLVILTSQFSASASEIVAGSLKDYGRALIVGPTQTYGKGTVQYLLPLTSLNLPGQIKITRFQYFLAGGSSVQLKGVEPDVTIPGPKLMDDMLERAAENAVPWTQMDGKLDAADPDVQRWTAWKTAHLAELQGNSKKRIEANPDFKDAFDFKKKRAKDLAAKAALETSKPLKPDEPPPLEEAKKDEKDVQAEEAVAIIQDMVPTWPAGGGSTATAVTK